LFLFNFNRGCFSICFVPLRLAFKYFYFSLDSWEVNCTATKLLPVFTSNGYTTRQNNSFFAYELPSSIEGIF